VRAIIIGLQRDRADDGDNAGRDIVIGFKDPVYVYDLRHPGPAQHAAQVALTLDAVAPAVIAVAPAPLPALAVTGPAEARLGTVAEFTIVPVGTNVRGQAYRQCRGDRTRRDGHPGRCD